MLKSLAKYIGDGGEIGNLSDGFEAHTHTTPYLSLLILEKLLMNIGNLLYQL